MRTETVTIEIALTMTVAEGSDAKHLAEDIVTDALRHRANAHREDSGLTSFAVGMAKTRKAHTIADWCEVASTT